MVDRGHTRGRNGEDLGEVERAVAVHQEAVACCRVVRVRTGLLVRRRRRRQAALQALFKY